MAHNMFNAHAKQPIAQPTVSTTTTQLEIAAPCPLPFPPHRYVCSSLL